MKIWSQSEQKLGVSSKNMGIYVRKSLEKSFWKKNLEIKTLEKKSEKVLGKNVTGNKVLCFGFLFS